MKTTIFAENFLKVFKIRSNDGPKYHVFSIPKIIFLEVSTKNHFWKRPNQVQGRK